LLRQDKLQRDYHLLRLRAFCPLFRLLWPGYCRHRHSEDCVYAFSCGWWLA